LRLDLASKNDLSVNSIYFTSKIIMPASEVIIIGADAIVHSLIKEKIELLGSFSFTPKLVEMLYRDIPAQYAFIIIEKEHISVISDPYGIIKIYYYIGDDNVVLTDSLKELEAENLSLDSNALKYYFVTGYTPSKHTFFEQVHKVEPFTINIFDKKGLIETHTYGQFGTKAISGNEFLDRFQQALSKVLDFTKKHYESPEMALSGGIDSSFLLMLMSNKKMIKDSKLSAFRMKGLAQKTQIDNEYDLSYAAKLADMFSKSLSLVDYDFNGEYVADDFNLLSEALGCEYAPAMGYVGYCRAVDSGNVLINGQNADSVLSFGGLGWPRLSGIKITGLNGFFTRYFQFFGSEHKNNSLGVVAKLLRNIFYRLHFPQAKNIFTRQNYFKGLGLNPENRYYFSSDPAYQNIEDPDELADWFESQYIKPIQETYKGLTDHGLSVILYNKTYMQGSANRSTVLSALLFNKAIFLPYTSIEVLELMSNLKPDWRYVFYGKYPNIELGKNKLALPKFIIDRQDPNNSDSTNLLYLALAKNKNFNDFIVKILANTNFSRYEGILSEDCIGQLKGQINGVAPQEMGLLMRFVWVESILQKHCVI
jgi:hypothetical protein